MILNPAFSLKLAQKYKNCSQLGAEDIEKVLYLNSELDSEPELRLQDFYTFELWQKIAGLNLDKLDWSKLSVMDICAGTGYVSYHLLKRIRPKKLTLVDVSEKALAMARELLTPRFPLANLAYICQDFHKLYGKDNFDVIIGNSFLHHFYNLPVAIRNIKKCLAPGGVFIGLHEPTPAAVPLESGNLQKLLWFLLFGNRSLDWLRPDDNIVGHSTSADVWLLTKKDMVRIFHSAGFKEIKMQNWHLLRSWIFARNKLQLTKEKLKLTEREIDHAKLTIIIDKALQKIIPSKFFGSLSLAAKK